MYSVYWLMQKLISNNKSNNGTPETKCNKTNFHLFKINAHWFWNAARSHN